MPAPHSLSRKSRCWSQDKLNPALYLSCSTADVVRSMTLNPSRSRALSPLARVSTLGRNNPRSPRPTTKKASTLTRRTSQSLIRMFTGGGGGGGSGSGSGGGGGWSDDSDGGNEQKKKRRGRRKSKGCVCFMFSCVVEWVLVLAPRQFGSGRTSALITLRCCVLQAGSHTHCNCISGRVKQNPLLNQA